MPTHALQDTVALRRPLPAHLRWDPPPVSRTWPGDVDRDMLVTPRLLYHLGGGRGPGALGPHMGPSGGCGHGRVVAVTLGGQFEVVQASVSQVWSWVSENPDDQ